MPEVMYRVAREYDVVAVRIPDDVLKRRDAMVSQGKCLGCGRDIEEGEKKTCGQCSTCYPATAARIRLKKVNRNDLIRSGELLPQGKPGPKPKNDYTRKLAEM